MLDSSDKNFIREFKQCPACGSTERFFESIVNELKAAGRVPQDWNMYWDVRQDPIFPPAKLAMLPIGAEVPAHRIVTDICQGCGNIYVVKMQRTVAKIGIKQPAPGGQEIIDLLGKAPNPGAN